MSYKLMAGSTEIVTGIQTLEEAEKFKAFVQLEPAAMGGTINIVEVQPELEFRERFNELVQLIGPFRAAEQTEDLEGSWEDRLMALEEILLQAQLRLGYRNGPYDP